MLHYPLRSCETSQKGNIILKRKIILPKFMHQLSVHALIVPLFFLATVTSFILPQCPNRQNGHAPAIIDGCRQNQDDVHKLHKSTRLSRGVSKGRRQATKMLFSVPDIGNLLFAPTEQRFFNPIWFPYFARPTNVEKVQIPVSRNPLWRTEEPELWMFEQPIGFLNITVNIRFVYTSFEAIKSI
jgi:hypothetical protein